MKKTTHHDQNERFILKIGELAEILNTTPNTIRQYEALGIITPSRTEGGTRLYAKKDFERLKIALKLTKIGIDLDTVQSLATSRQLYSSGKKASTAMLPKIEELRSKISSLMNELTELNQDLDRASVLIRQCLDCENTPNRKHCPECPVDKNIDLTGIARLVWDPECP